LSPFIIFGSFGGRGNSCSPLFTSWRFHSLELFMPGMLRFEFLVLFLLRAVVVVVYCVPEPTPCCCVVPRCQKYIGFLVSELCEVCIFDLFTFLPLP